MNEKWKPVFGYEDHYEISNLGNARRISANNGTYVGKQLKQYENKGYKRHCYCVNNQPKYHSVHRSVWQSFNGEIPPHLQINHKNGIKDDNRLENLELMTPSENTKHAYQVLGIPGKKNPCPGSKNGRAKLKEDDAPKIRRLYSEGLSQQRIADLYGVNQTNISSIVRGIGWKHTL